MCTEYSWGFVCASCWIKFGNADGSFWISCLIWSNWGKLANPVKADKLAEFNPCPSGIEGIPLIKYYTAL